jgi:hypothetical protein
MLSPHQRRVVAEIQAAVNLATPGRWFVEEGDMSWDLYAEHEPFIEPLTGKPMAMHPLKLIKAPKQSKEFAEYWPPKADENLIVYSKVWINQLIEIIQTLDKEE